MNEPIDNPEGSIACELSEAGRARRATLLSELQAVMVARRRRRSAARAAAGMLAAAALVLALWRPWTREVREVREPAAPPVASATPPPSFIERIADDPTVLARHALTTSVPVPVIDDEELLRILASAQRPTGLIRIPEGRSARVILTEVAQDDSSEPVPLARLPERG